MALSGVAHGIIDHIPTEGTFLLNKGERVINRQELSFFFHANRVAKGAVRFAFDSSVQLEAAAEHTQNTNGVRPGQGSGGLASQYPPLCRLNGYCITASEMILSGLLIMRCLVGLSLSKCRLRSGTS